ncbi:MAG: hypothetical protein SPF22_07685 [Candidatus Onthovivens sp.]|nr:hypothetical protein [Candidatus Onthovivens sp.]
MTTTEINEIITTLKNPKAPISDWKYVCSIVLERAKLLKYNGINLWNDPLLRRALIFK